VCHACGHDVHTTILLGTSLFLAQQAEAGLLPGRVRLIFQPAEELPGGALEVMASGGISGVDRIFGLHCDPRLDVGKVGLKAGPITSACDKVSIRVSGPGGHTARPHLTADLVYALGAVVTELPALLSRLADPRSGLSVVWGQVHAGSAANAIPQQGFAEGTIRCLDAGVWESAHNVVPDLVRRLAAPYGVDVDIDMHTSVPPCVNDEAQTAFLRAVALGTFGVEALRGTDQSLGGEDFAWILGRTPGALARLGVRNLEVADAGDLHQGGFDIDESAIGVGVRLFCAAALTPFPA
jgi:amidohydrolase